MLSMTGFGEGRAPLGDGQVVVEARAVNHRYLDVRVRAPQDLGELAAPVEDAMRVLLRGRIEAQVRVEAGAQGRRVVFDELRARAAFEALAGLRDRLAPAEPVPLSLLSLVPDLFVAPRVDADEATRRAAEEAARLAAAALTAMRAREGAALAEDLRSRLDTVAALVAELRQSAAPAAVEAGARIRERVERLLEGSGATLDPSRLAQEIALLAERSDVTEELTRLESHLAQFRSALDAGDAAVGRRLDFLLQEMNREANTTGAKSNDAALTHLVVDLKAELERLREQVQNIL